jgi:hypothetical protein
MGHPPTASRCLTSRYQFPAGASPCRATSPAGNRARRPQRATQRKGWSRWLARSRRMYGANSDGSRLCRVGGVFIRARAGGQRQRASSVLGLREATRISSFSGWITSLPRLPRGECGTGPAFGRALASGRRADLDRPGANRRLVFANVGVGNLRVSLNPIPPRGGAIWPFG